MYIVRKEFKFCSAHQLEDAFTKLCSDTIHGHNYLLEVFLKSLFLPNRTGGMVVDFGEIKFLFKKYIDDILDHSLMIPLSFSSTNPEYVKCLMENNKRMIVLPFNPTAENLAKHIHTTFQNLLNMENFPTSISLCSIRVWETDSSYAEYSPE